MFLFADTCFYTDISDILSPRSNTALWDLSDLSIFSDAVKVHAESDFVNWFLKNYNYVHKNYNCTIQLEYFYFIIFFPKKIALSSL